MQLQLDEKAAALKQAKADAVFLKAVEDAEQQPVVNSLLTEVVAEEKTTIASEVTAESSIAPEVVVESPVGAICNTPVDLDELVTAVASLDTYNGLR